MIFLFSIFCTYCIFFYILRNIHLIIFICIYILQNIYFVYIVYFSPGNISGIVPLVNPRQREPTLVRANLTWVTSFPAQLQAAPVLSSLYPSISFSSLTFPGAPYQIFLLCLPWLPCHFYLVVITTTTNILLYDRISI